MFSSDQYQLIDFGAGRKLERFGRLLLDRPCPAAERVSIQDRSVWQAAAARYDRAAADTGSWTPGDGLPNSWNLTHGPIQFELVPTPFGHLGVFPEQAANWDWIAAQVDRAARPLKVLNLFAYTGGSTLAAAAAGAEVVHVDAAANVVVWARRNAQLSQLAEKPIRWITEDALKFVRREVRRGSRYDALILDPPSFGRGPKGEVWKATEHLPDLLAACAELTRGQAEFVLVTCHTPEISAAGLASLMDSEFSRDNLDLDARPLTLCTQQGRELPSGIVCHGQKKP